MVNVRSIRVNINKQKKNNNITYVFMAWLGSFVTFQVMLGDINKNMLCLML